MNEWILIPSLVQFSASDQDKMGLNWVERRQRSRTKLVTIQQGTWSYLERPTVDLESTKPLPQASPNLNLLRRRWRTEQTPASNRRQPLLPSPQPWRGSNVIMMGRSLGSMIWTRRWGVDTLLWSNWPDTFSPVKRYAWPCRYMQ